MRLEERYKGILQWFEENVPQPQTELNYRNPYELLVAVILSAQCTDKRVNMVTPAFFELYPTPEVLAVASVEAVFDSIKSVSYPNNKAKHLVGMAQVLVNEFNGIVPDTVEQLEKMPGVGRKTANVIASVIYNKPITDRADTGEAYTSSHDSKGASLAYSTWEICVLGKKTQMCTVWIATLVPLV